MAAVGELEDARATLRRARRIWPGVPQQRDAEEFFAIEYADPVEARTMLAELSKTFPVVAARMPIWSAYIDSLACRCNIVQVSKALVEAAGANQIDADLAIAALIRLGDTEAAYLLARSRLPTGRARGGSLLFSLVAQPLRQEARFMDLAEHLGLSAYWRASGDWPEYCSQPGLPYDCKAEAARAGSKP